MIFKNFFIKFINVLFVFITGTLFVLSLSRHSYTDMATYEQIKSLKPHQPLVYGLIAMAMSVTLIVLYLFLKRYVKSSLKGCSVLNIISIIAVVIIGILGIVWINLNDTVPHSDQAVIFKEAQKLAGYSDEPYEWSYMSSFNFMRLLVLFISLLLKLFGNTQIVFRYINVLALVFLSIGMILVLKVSLKDKALGALISLALIFFYPVVIYTCYIYGTLSAVAFEIWAFYFSERLVDSLKTGHTGKKLVFYVLAIIICIFLGVEMHMSALIGMVAISIYVLLSSTKKSWWINAVLVVGMFGFYVIANTGVNKAYEKITNSPYQDAIPISAKVYMGLTAPETQPGGPGAQDGSYWEMFELNDMDAKKTNAYLWPIIGDVAKEYLTGKRPLSFFIKKAEYQWLDPTMDAHRVILLNNPANDEPDNSPAYTKFYYSSFRDIAYKLITVFMVVVYGFSCVAGVFLFFRKADEEHENLDINFLIQIFIIGGFVFQLIAESVSRYVFSYYVLILIEAFYGISIVGENINKKLRNFGHNIN